VFRARPSVPFRRVANWNRLYGKAILDFCSSLMEVFFFFHCNYNINDYNINSIFYLEMLQWWSEFCSNFLTNSKAFDSIIWNNCNIKIDGKPMCYHNYINAGIIFISDLMFSRNNIESFNIAKDKGLIGSNYLTWSAVHCSVPKYLRTLIVDRNVLNTLEVKCGNKDFDPLSSKSKNFYALLIKVKTQTFKRVL